MKTPLPTPPSLRELQLGLSQAIASERLAAGAAPGWIAAQPPLSPRQRLQIYRDAWWLRLSESLEEDYEATARCLGRAAFVRLVRSYLAAHPSSSYTLAHTGDRLPEFLSRWRDPAAAARPWLRDLARLERAGYQAFYARDLEPWDPSRLSQLTPAQGARLRLRLQPAATLLESRWRIAPLVERGRTARSAPSRVLVYRQGFDIERMELEPRQYRLLQLAVRGAHLGEWARIGGHDARWIDWLQAWARAGIIAPATRG